MEMQRQYVEAVPIRRIAFSTPEAWRNVKAAEAQVLVEAGNESALLEFVAFRLSAQPEESDVIHELLAFLAERMIRLNKQKQAEMKRFVVWLEGLLKVSADDF